MADALRHLTRLGVYKVGRPVSRKFLRIFCANKNFRINELKLLLWPGDAVRVKRHESNVMG